MGFKDMMKNFLYESVEDDELEDEIQAENPAPTKKPEPVNTQPASQTPAPAPNPAQEVQTVEQSSSIDRYLINQEEAQSSGSFLSDIEDVVMTEQPKTRTGRRPARTTKHAAPARQNPRMDYSAVLSPIYGNMSDSEKDVAKVHDAINLPKPEDNLEMVEVISPMFGSSKPATRTRKPKNPDREMKAAPSKDAGKLEPIVVEEELPATVSAPADLSEFLTGSSNKNKNRNNSRKGGGKR